MSIAKTLRDQLRALHRPSGLSPLALVVEDDPLDLEIACSALLEAGCRVETANCGEVAIRLMQYANRPENESIDIVFLDLKLPGMNGVHVLKWIRENMPKDQIVVLITHAAYSTMIADAAKFGFLELIEKPFTAECVREIFAKHRI